MKKILASLVLLMLISAQTTTYALTVPDGTDVFIVPDNGVNSKNIVSSTIKATIKEDVLVNNEIVFRAGDKATFTIQDYEKAGAWGNGGEITIGNGYATDVNGSKRKILISQKIEGKDKTCVKGTCACGLILWPLLLFGFVHGGEAKINSGYEITATTAGSFDL